MAVKSRKSRGIVADIFEWVTDLGLKIGALAFLIVLGYLIYGLFSNQGIMRLGQLSPEDQARVLHNITLACKALGASGTIFALSIAVRYYMEETVGYIMSLIGALLYFGTPWLFSTMFDEARLNSNPAVAVIIAQVRMLGLVAFVPGVILIIRDIVVRIALTFEDAQKRRQRAEGKAFLVGKDAELAQKAEERVKENNFYARCWETQYCKPYVRKFCPAYQKRKSCWRLKSGCFCDERTIIRAMQAEGAAGEDFKKDIKYRVPELADGHSKLTKAQKKQLCRNCVIYQTHQQQKYRLISPLVLPVVGIIIWKIYPLLRTEFMKVVAFTDSFMAKVSFLPHGGQTQTPGSAAIPDAVFIFFIIWLAIVGISYLLRFVEYCIFKLQI